MGAFLRPGTLSQACSEMEAVSFVTCIEESRRGSGAENRLGNLTQPCRARIIKSIKTVPFCRGEF